MFGRWLLFSLFIIICPFLLAGNCVNMQLEDLKAETAGSQRLIERKLASTRLFGIYIMANTAPFVKMENSENRISRPNLLITTGPIWIVLMFLAGVKGRKMYGHEATRRKTGA